MHKANMCRLIAVHEYYRDDPSVEAIELKAATVNPPNTRVGPGDFELLKVLGKGGYGKVFV